MSLTLLTGLGDSHADARAYCNEVVIEIETSREREFSKKVKSSFAPGFCENSLFTEGEGWGGSDRAVSSSEG